LLSEQEIQVFTRVRDLVSRGACERALRSMGLVVGTDEYELAKTQWHAMPHLAGEGLRSTSKSVLVESCGPLVLENTPFEAMIWYGGATDSYAGHRFTGSFKQFIDYVLVARSKEISPKRCGWVVTPTSNINGHRTNASTTAMHALNLDCDGRGEWSRLISILESVGLAYIAYQSGGWKIGEPKWHLLLPLAAPFVTTTQEKISTWKTLYHHARVLLGSLAELTGEGFDPTCETPCQPVFITERREEVDPPRQVIWRTGCALDLMGLAALLPSVDDEAVPEYAAAEERDLGSEDLERIVATLVVPMSKIFSGRRDLYLCLPGALLDRGVAPDAVLTVVEEISRRCPGDTRYTAAEVAEKHREHMHCARTTVSKYEASETYTRIGTLSASWPEVAFAIDEALPDQRLLLMRALVEKMATAKAAAKASAPGPTYVAPVFIDLAFIRERLKDLRRKKKSSTNADNKVRGYMLEMLLDGKSIVPFFEGEGGKKDPVIDKDGKEIDIDKSLNIICALVAQAVPKDTHFDAIAEVIRPSLFISAQEHGADFAALMKRAEHIFAKSIGFRVERQEKKARDDENQRLASCK